MSISEQTARAARRPRVQERQQPDYLAFAKITGGWVKLGAAWKTQFRNGGEGFSLQFSVLPLGNWDGRFILAVPDQEPPEE